MWTDAQVFIYTKRNLFCSVGHPAFSLKVPWHSLHAKTPLSATFFFCLLPFLRGTETSISCRKALFPLPLPSGHVGGSHSCSQDLLMVIASAVYMPQPAFLQLSQNGDAFLTSTVTAKLLGASDHRTWLAAHSSRHRWSAWGKQWLSRHCSGTLIHQASEDRQAFYWTASTEQDTPDLYLVSIISQNNLGASKQETHGMLEHY